MKYIKNKNFSILFGIISGIYCFQPLKASPQFKITAASPGAIDFTGSGTGQFNNSIATNNNFQVGASTNLGVNSSASSTMGYRVSSHSKLELAETSF